VGVSGRSGSGQGSQRAQRSSDAIVPALQVAEVVAEGDQGQRHLQRSQLRAPSHPLMIRSVVRSHERAEAPKRRPIIHVGGQ
jgi:hypothetical protein